MADKADDKKKDKKESEDDVFRQSGAIHDSWKKYLLDLSRAVKDRNTYELSTLYETDWNELTEKFYKASSIPPVDKVFPSIVPHDDKFVLIYKELYYRHLYQKHTPKVEDRIDSFVNYINLFNLFSKLDDDHPQIDLPAQWLWDIIEEFIFQFRSFHHYRSNIHLAHLEDAELKLVQEHAHTWSPQTVISYLHTLAKKGGVDLSRNWGKDEKDSKRGEEPSHILFTTLAHFSLIGLSRIYCLLGDYTSALRVLDSIDLQNKKNPYQNSLSAKSSLYYNMGFAYLMLRRYADAAKSFSYFLVYVNRNKQVYARSGQRARLEKQAEKMYGLLALANQFAPQSLDESIANTVKLRSSRNPEALFDECAPKFVSCAPPNYDELPNDDEEIRDVHELQKKIFMTEFKQRVNIPEIYSYLKMCTNVHVSKLDKFLQSSEKKTDEDTLTALIKLKHKTRNLRWSVGESFSAGKWVSASEVDFYIEKDIVYIRESRNERPYGDIFLRNIFKLQDIIEELRKPQ